MYDTNLQTEITKEFITFKSLVPTPEGWKEKLVTLPTHEFINCCFETINTILGIKELEVKGFIDGRRSNLVIGIMKSRKDAAIMVWGKGISARYRDPEVMLSTSEVTWLVHKAAEVITGAGAGLGVITNESLPTV